MTSRHSGSTPSGPVGVPRNISPGQRPAEPEPIPITVSVPAELVDEATDAYHADRESYPDFSSWVAEAVQRRLEETAPETVSGKTAEGPPGADPPPDRTAPRAVDGPTQPGTQLS
jgi:hypothetical protein